MNPNDPNNDEQSELLRTIGKLIIFIMLIMTAILIAMAVSGCATMIPIGQDGKYGSIRLSAYWFPPCEYDQSAQPPKRINSSIEGFSK